MGYNLLKSFRYIIIYLFAFLWILIPTPTFAYFTIIAKNKKEYKNDTYIFKQCMNF